MSHTVLSFGLTPGDIEMGCGGVLARLAELGHTCVNVFLSYHDEPLREMEDEAREATRTLQAGDVCFIDTPQGRPESRETTIEAARLIRTFRPDFVFTFHPSESQPDQLALSCAVQQAVTLAAQDSHPDLPGKPWKVLTVFGFELKPPLVDYDLAVSIDRAIETKTAAIRCYELLALHGYDKAMLGLAAYRGPSSRAGKYAEVFKLLSGGYDPFHEWD